VRSDFPFPTLSKQSRKFESLDVWKLLKDGRGSSLLPWYFAVSTNHMPAKYLISKSISCNVTNLSLANEEVLWKEHRDLIETFLKTWKEVRSGQVDLISDQAWQKTSLMDLNVEVVNRMLTHCNFCRWNCQVDRSVQTVGDGAAKTKKHGTCQLESTSKVSSYFHHRGEEIIFRGTIGSGTIFFTSCNMRCAFCQNGDISTDKDNGIPITPNLLALMIWQLRMEGCHNTNWVGGDPTIHLHTIVQAISMLDSFEISSIRSNKEELNNIEAVKAGSYNNYFSNWRMDPEYAFYKKRLFNSPQLWNSNFFMSKQTMCVLRSLIDVWLPDFKFGPGKCALDLSRTPWYWDTVTNNLRLIYEWGEDFVIRHLIMPEEITRSYQYARELGLNFEKLSYEKSVFGLNL